MFEIKKDKNKFYIVDDEKFIGEITYFENEKGYLVVNRTYVNPGYRGQKLALRLVEHMVGFARKENKKIIPTCPYVFGLFQNDERFLDVWHQDPHDYEVACSLG